MILNCFKNSSIKTSSVGNKGNTHSNLCQTHIFKAFDKHRENKIVMGDTYNSKSNKVAISSLKNKYPSIEHIYTIAYINGISLTILVVLRKIPTILRISAWSFILDMRI